MQLAEFALIQMFAGIMCMFAMWLEWSEKMAAGQTKKQFCLEAQDQYSRPGYRPNGENLAGNEVGPNTKQFLNVLSRLESDIAWKAALASAHS